MSNASNNSNSAIKDNSKQDNPAPNSTPQPYRGNDIIHSILGVLGCVLLAIGFFTILGNDWQKHETSVSNKHKLFKGIKDKDPKYLLQCDVTQVGDMQQVYANVPSRVKYYGFVIDTKQCGQLEVNELRNYMGDNMTFTTSIYHQLQAGKAYNIWVDRKTGEHRQMYAVQQIKSVPKK